MSSVDFFKEFVNERLTAAAEEIFGVFAKTIVEYEEEINRQRKLLDIVWKPEIKIHRIEVPQQREEEDLTDQQLNIQERISSLDQEDPEPPRVKEELWELCTSQEVEQLVVKLKTPAYKESDHSEDQTMSLTPDETLSAVEKTAAANVPVINSVFYDETSDHQLSCIDQEEPKQQRHQKNESPMNNVSNMNLSEDNCNTDQVRKSYKCDTCGKDFERELLLQRHQRIHTGEKPFICDTCGRDFPCNNSLTIHMRTHAHKKPYICKTCGKVFADQSKCNQHMTAHTGEKPFACQMCGIVFRQTSHLTEHMRIHTGEKSFACNTCQKGFASISSCRRHMRIHTGETPFTCQICGRVLSSRSGFKVHMRTHTGEKPFICKICGRRFNDRSTCKRHMRIHTSGKPFPFRHSGVTLP